MSDIDLLREHYDALRIEARRLAGGLLDLAQRAAVYHHLYEHSRRNHIFPLIAAHGALWARGYFRFGMKLGRLCSWQYALSPETRSARLEGLAAFADAFRDINRQVCVETYVSYHFVERFGDHPDAAKFVPQSLLAVLNRCHAARRGGQEFSTREKREMFQAFFLNEQETVVGPQIRAAVDAFGWPLMKRLALQPRIRFAYFPLRRRLVFRNFAERDERIENGLRAFDMAAEVGWDRAESTLRDYAVLPEAFFVNSAARYEGVREAALAAA